MRESVYAELSAAERAREHGRAAKLVAGDPERAALHVLASDPAKDPEAVKVLREAAASARRRGATEVAVDLLRRALREGVNDDRLHRELGSAELQAGHYDAAAEQLAIAGDPAELGTALQLANRPEEAVEALTQAIDALDDDQRELGLLLQSIRGAASQDNLDGGGGRAASRVPVHGAARRPADPRRAPVRRPASPTARR